MEKFKPGVMLNKYGASSYRTDRRPASAIPSLRFFGQTIFGPLLWLWRKAANNKCDDYAWIYSSNWLARDFESAGGQIIVDGLENVASLRGPCVFIANHMSALETFLLPGMIRPYMPLTYVVKKSLTTLPIFGPIMRSRDPVVVGRKNPREDLATVLSEGARRLENGVSIVVFPQHTRSLYFDEKRFNTIGVKLARQAGVPVVPIALKTDVWGQGKRIKELAAIRPEFPARFQFGKETRVNGNGKEEHREICRFIRERVEKWQKEDGINS